MLSSYGRLNTIAILIAAAGLYLTSLHNYLLFHSLAELFSIVVAFSLFSIAWNSRKYLENQYLLFIGFSYLFIAGLDLLHTLSYKGMSIFADYDYYANQLWIGARYMESLSLLAAYLFIGNRRKVNTSLTLSVFLVLTALIITSVFYWKNFPECFVEGKGLTTFKVVSEYIISGILALDLLLLYRFRRHFDNQVLKYMVWSLLLTITSELSFTFYISNYGFSNLIGHYTKIASFYLIYKAIIVTGIVQPYNLIFRELKQNQERLVEAKAVAENAAQAKSRFLATMSHEIRSPLNSIINMTDLTLRTDLDDKQREYLLDAKFSADHLLSVVNDILDYSKIEAGELKLESIDFDLSATVNATIRTMEYLALRKNLYLKSEMDPGAPRYLKGDPSRLRQVLVNLVGNAVKFTETGGIRVIVEPDAESAAPEGGIGLRVSVIDTGIGINPEHQKDIFNDFQQADSAISRKYGGTGLGLAITKDIVSLMGGDIRVVSEPGKGSTFHFTARFDLGQKDRVKETPYCQEPDIQPQGDSKRILVVDDNLMNAKVARLLLTRLGHDVVNAGNASEALETLKSVKFDLVLMDLEMPEIDGLEATRRILAGEGGKRAKHTPIIAMTAHTLPEIREACYQAGMVDYVTKPLNLIELASVINRTGSGRLRDHSREGKSAEATAEILDMNCALNTVGGDKEFLQEILMIFRDELPSRLENIRKCIEKNDIESIAKVAHSLKSSSSVVCAEACRYWAEKVEYSARNDGSDLPELLDKLTHAVNAVESKINDPKLFV